MSAPSVSAAVILNSLAEYYSRPYHLIVPEFPIKDGPRKEDVSWVDAVLFYRDNPRRRLAFEIKTSRRDYIAELRNPDKRRRAMAFCSAYCFVVPEDVIEVDDLPPDCGLMLWQPMGGFCICRMPEEKDVRPPTYEEFFDMARRAIDCHRRVSAR